MKRWSLMVCVICGLILASSESLRAAWWQMPPTQPEASIPVVPLNKISNSAIRKSMKGPFCIDPDMKFDQSPQYHSEDRLEKATTTWSEKMENGTVAVKTGTDECKGDFLKEYHCMEYDFNNPDQTRFTTIKCSEYGSEKCIDGACVKVDKDGKPIVGSGSGNGGQGDACGGTCQSNETCVKGSCQPKEEWCSGKCGTPGCPMCEGDINTNDCQFIDGKDVGNSEFVGGSITFKQGDILIKNKPDVCLDEKTLLEYGCNASGQKFQEQVLCEQGCDAAAGVCIKGGCVDGDAGAESKTWGNDLIGTFSFDYKYATPSSAYVQDGSVKKGEKNDYCMDGSGNKVEKGVAVAEAYCKDNAPAYEGFTCPTEVTIDLLVYSKTIKLFDGCCNGACYKEAGMCTDMDGGSDYTKAAMAIRGNGCGVPPDTGIDTCGMAIYNTKGGVDFKKSGSFGDSVLEYTCKNNEIASEWRFCDQGNNWGCQDGACVDLSDKVCKATILQSGNPDLPGSWPMVDNGKEVTGLELRLSGDVVDSIQHQSCDNDKLTTYVCAEDIQSGQPGEFVKPSLYMIKQKKACILGCPSNSGECHECLEDVQEWPNIYKNNMCGEW